MQNSIPNHGKRFLERSTLMLSVLVLLHEPLPSQMNRVDNKTLKRAQCIERMFLNGLPVLLPRSHKNVLTNDVEKELAARHLLPDVESKVGVSDTGMFRPVSGPYGGTVRSIVVDPGGWLFIATDGGVYRSTDNGSRWDMHLFPSQLYNSVEPVTILGPNIVVAETDFSNFISTNRGESWNYLAEDVQGFVVDTNGEIYAGSNYGGVKKSTDTAKSWIPFALAGKKIWKVVLCGEGKLACPSDSGIFFSSDKGITWIFRPYETMYTWNLVSDKRDHLFVLSWFGQYFQLYRSSDFGDSWQHIVLPVTEDVWRIYIEDDGRVFITTDTRILTSTDAGETWISLGSPPWMPLTVGRDAEGRLLCGSFYGVYRRNETNGEWEELNNGIHARRIEQIQFTSAGSILVLSLWQCFRSSNAGSNWSMLQFDSTISLNAYAPILSCSSGSIFMAASFDNYAESGLLRSTDDGISWRKISVLSNYYAIYDITEGASGDILAATYFGDIYRSTNNGDSWSKVLSSSSQSALKCVVSDREGNYYAARDTSILLSHDGIAWTEIPLRRNDGYWESMAVDKQGEVFLGSAYNGVYHSSDQGRTWNLMNDGLFDRYVMSTTADDSGNVVLGTASGVFRLADSVDSWLRFSNGFPRTWTTSLSVSPQGFLFAGTQSYGMYKSTSPIGRRILTIKPPPPPPNGEILDFSLLQNYPNPFNNQTVIRYDVPSNAKVEIKIYNILGQMVATLISGDLPTGKYSVEWTPIESASGVYFLEIRAWTSSKTFQKTIKLLYLR